MTGSNAYLGIAFRIHWWHPSELASSYLLADFIRLDSFEEA